MCIFRFFFGALRLRSFQSGIRPFRIFFEEKKKNHHRNTFSITDVSASNIQVMYQHQICNMYTKRLLMFLIFFFISILNSRGSCRSWILMDPPNPCGAETLPISIGAFISAILAFMMGGSWDLAGIFAGIFAGIWLGLVQN